MTLFQAKNVLKQKMNLNHNQKANRLCWSCSNISAERKGWWHWSTSNRVESHYQTTSCTVFQGVFSLTDFRSPHGSHSQMPSADDKATWNLLLLLVHLYEIRWLEVQTAWYRNGVLLVRLGFPYELIWLDSSSRTLRLRSQTNYWLWRCLLHLIDRNWVIASIQPLPHAHIPSPKHTTHCTSRAR